MSKEGQLRICVEKLLPHEQHIHKEHQKQGNSEHHIARLRAAFFAAKVWKNHTTIPVAFIENGDEVEWTPTPELKPPLDPIEDKIRKLSPIEAVKTVIKERIQPIVGLRFVFVDKADDALVRIGFDPEKGSWANLGTDCKHTKKKERTVNYAWLDAGTIMHEFGHVCGMIHEHQNPRGNTIDWNKKAVFEWAKRTQGWDKKTTETNILNKYDIKQINGSQFDPNSVMLYFFPASLTLNHKGTHMNVRLSELDVEWLNKMYPNNVNALRFYHSIYGGGMGWEKIVVIALVIVVVVAVGFYWFKKRRKRRK